MTLSLEGRVSCLLCGYQIRVMTCPPARVNKRSVRQLPGLYLSWRPGICPECDTDNHHVRQNVRYRLTPESEAQIAAYRARRWPERGAA